MCSLSIFILSLLLSFKHTHIYTHIHTHTHTYTHIHTHTHTHSHKTSFVHSKFVSFAHSLANLISSHFFGSCYHFSLLSLLFSLCLPLTLPNFFLSLSPSFFLFLSLTQASWLIFCVCFSSNLFLYRLNEKLNEK